MTSPVHVAPKLITAEDAENTEDAEDFVINDPNWHSGQVVDAAIKVHSALGPGLLESAYETCLAYELQKRGLLILQQTPLPIVYEDVRLDVGYRIDLLVGDAVLVELKTVTRILPIHDAQLLSYLRLSGRKIGLLINFNVVHLRDGLKRMVNNL